MAVLASSIMAKVRSQLIDDGTTPRWSDAELLRFLSDGQRTIVAIDPSASAIRSVVQLTAGTIQNLPTNGATLLRVIRNMGTSGSTPGRAVRVSSLDHMDSQDPDWHARARVTDIKNFMLDPEDGTIFYVCPPANGLGYVEINYSIVPPDLSGPTDPIDLHSIYQTPLFDYTMWRAHLKDSEVASGTLAGQYLQAFQLFMQVKSAGDAGADARQELASPNAAMKG